MPDELEFVQSTRTILTQARLRQTLYTYPLTKWKAILRFIRLRYVAMTFMCPEVFKKTKTYLPIFVIWIPNKIDVVQFVSTVFEQTVFSGTLVVDPLTELVTIAVSVAYRDATMTFAFFEQY